MKDTDRNFLSVADVDGRTLEDLRIDPESEGQRRDEFDDILKFSHARNVVARRLWVAGGTENAIDMNRECRAIRVEDSTLISGRQCAIVIKGGSEAIAFTRVKIAPAEPDTAYDIEIGGWSDQSMERTRNVTLQEVTRWDGKAVRVVVGHADRPVIIGGRCRVLFWRSLALKTFWLARYWARRIANR